MSTQITYRDAIVAAQREALAGDPRVIVMGEDVGAAGGPFKTTQELYEEFGPRRVRDTPISETAFVGAALGMAVTGYRPIIELMFADFMGVCFDQIVNSIAKHRFMCGGRLEVPLVIRTIGGGGARFGAQHSQTGETWVRQFPGLKVYCPATASDAFHLLRQAIDDPDPVIILEHKALMSTQGEVDFTCRDSELKPAPRVVRSGQHATVVSSLAMLRRCIAAADALSRSGVEAEVIDIRALRPFDARPILDSVKKTGFLVTVEENHELGGWGGDVISRAITDVFDWFDRPPVRVTLPIGRCRTVPRSRTRHCRRWSRSWRPS